MLNKMACSLYRAYWNAKMRLVKLGQEEDGMETLETVILIAVAVILAGVVVVFLLGANKDGSDGIIHDLFEGIKQKIGEATGFTMN